MLKCNDITKLTSSEEIESLGFMKRLEYRMHLMMCNHCRLYVQQIKVIGRVTSRIWSALGGDAARIADLEDRIMDMLD